MEILGGGGILATFSCSQAVDAASFTMAVSWAGVDAKRDVQIVQRLGQGADHPVLASFPESEYLKGLICRLA
jgi:23S rRNA (cytosine1962-C5)-methyltransferase